jgi:chemotaxis family two-component system sensor kinase Cph1
MNCTDVPLDEVVRQAQHDVSPETFGRNVQWRIQSLPTVHGDPTLLRHLFVHLLANALKFSRARDVATIEVGAHEEPDRWVMHVRDNGLGFDQRFVGRLFGVFQRLHSEREFEGTGIGLAIVHKIVARHRGDVWAEGRLDEGATFYFSLPKPTS